LYWPRSTIYMIFLFVVFCISGTMYRCVIFMKDILIVSLFSRQKYGCLIQQLSGVHQNIYISSSANQQSSYVFPYTMPTSFYGWLREQWHIFCSSSFVTIRCKFLSDSSTAERMLFIVIKLESFERTLNKHYNSVACFEYHKTCSAKCDIRLLQHNIKMDLSKVGLNRLVKKRSSGTFTWNKHLI
jgi:hypothetical protein